VSFARDAIASPGARAARPSPRRCRRRAPARARSVQSATNARLAVSGSGSRTLQARSDLVSRSWSPAGFRYGDEPHRQPGTTTNLASKLAAAIVLARERSSKSSRCEHPPRRLADVRIGRRAKVLAVAAVALASVGKPGVAHTRPSPSRYPTTRPPLPY
jgi:hypothetical protein